MPTDYDDIMETYTVAYDHGSEPTQLLVGQRVVDELMTDTSFMSHSAQAGARQATVGTVAGLSVGLVPRETAIMLAANNNETEYYII